MTLTLSEQVQIQEHQRALAARRIHDGPAGLLVSSVLHLEFAQRTAPMDMAKARLEVEHTLRLARLAQELLDMRRA